MSKLLHLMPVAFRWLVIHEVHVTDRGNDIAFNSCDSITLLLLNDNVAMHHITSRVTSLHSLFDEVPNE